MPVPEADSKAEEGKSEAPESAEKATDIVRPH